MSENRSLVALLRDFNALDELLIESGGEVNATLEEWMDLNKGALEDKIDGYKNYMDHLDSRAEYFKKIEAQAYAAKKLFENQIKRLKDNIRFCMAQRNETQLLGKDWRFKKSISEPKVTIVDPKAIPAKFTIETVIYEPDKEKIQKHFDAGFEVAGCELRSIEKLNVYANGGSKNKVVKSESK